MNRLILNYRVDPEVAAELLPARVLPRTVNGHALASISLVHDGATAEHSVAVERGVYVAYAAERATFTVEERPERVYISFKGDETVDVSVRTAHVLRGSELFPDARAAARFAGITHAEPVVVDWVRSSFFDRLPRGSAALDSALLLRDAQAFGVAA